MYLPQSVKQIRDYAFAYCPKLTIHAPADSYAEQYAKENNIPFQELYALLSLFPKLLVASPPSPSAYRLDLFFPRRKRGLLESVGNQFYLLHILPLEVSVLDVL